MEYDVKELKLAKEGKLRVEWAKQSMPVLDRIKERFAKDKPLKGIRLGACLHVTQGRWRQDQALCFQSIEHPG